MTKLPFDDIWQNINCLVPIYDNNGGNVTEVHLDDGTILIDKRKTCTVLNNIAKVFAVSIRVARSKYSKLIDRKLSIPIPLHRDLVLVPVKMRKPIAREDGAWGYVVLSKITCYDKHLESDDMIQIFFDNKLKVDGLLQKRSFKLIIEDARAIHREYTKLHGSKVTTSDPDKIKEKPMKYLLIPYVSEEIC